MITASTRPIAQSDDGERKVARGGVANLAGAAYSGVATFALTLFIARVADPDEAGLYFAAVSVLLVGAAITQLGVPVGYVYFLARFRGLERGQEFGRVLSSGAIPVVVVWLVVIGIAVPLRNPLGGLIFPGSADAAGNLVVLLVATLIVAIAADSALAATRGLGVMRPTVVADKIISPTVQLLAVALLALAGWTGGEQLVWTRIAGFVAVVLIGVPWLTRLLRRQGLRAKHAGQEVLWRPTRESLNEFWIFTGPRALAQIAQVGVQRLDIIFVALWAGPAEAAIYAAATRFLVFGQLAGHAIGTAVQPRFSELSAKGDRSRLQATFRLSTAWIICATWPFHLTFIVHADALMQVFGSRYQAGAGALQILALAMLVATSCGVVDAVLLMAGKSILTMINAWLALAINISLNIWLIPQIGILGAAIAWAASILTTNLIPLLQVKLTLGVHPFGRAPALAMVVTFLLFGVLGWAIKATGVGPFVSALVLVSTGAGYIALAWRWRSVLGLSGILRRDPTRSRQL